MTPRIRRRGRPAVHLSRLPAPRSDGERGRRGPHQRGIQYRRGHGAGDL